jgi:hypothetical protein
LNIDKFITSVRENFSVDADLNEQNDASLLFHLTLTYLWETQCLVRILCWKVPELNADQLIERAEKLSNNPISDYLTQTYSLLPAREPMEFLLLLRCWREQIRNELYDRMKPNDVGRELVAFLARLEMGTLNNSWILPVLTQLKVEKLQVKAYRKHQLDTEDLLLAAFETAVERHKELGETIGVTVEQPIPNLPDNFLGLPTEPDELRRRITTTVIITVSRLIRFFLPALRGQLEDLPELVRQGEREIFRKLNRHKTITTKREREIRCEVHKEDAFNPDLESVLDDRIASDRAYRTAQKKWGAKGTRFVNALCQGLNITDAAKKAGVSRKIGHKYLIEIRKVLSPKKSTN